jgi:rRNA maturation RNase YbeY
LNIKIFYDDTNYRLRNRKESLDNIKKVIRGEGKSPGDLSFIITSDSNLIKINKEFLNRNYYTDVIAFDYSEKKFINGEVYISIDTVKRNAINYNVSLRNELLRIMIHGVLHLCGYTDKKKKEKKEMSEREEKWLKLFYKKNEI